MRNAPKDRLFFYATDGKSVIVLLTFRFDGVFKFNVIIAVCDYHYFVQLFLHAVVCPIGG